jgi:hypothetical protein
LQMPRSLDPIAVIISRAEVEAGDITRVLNILQQFTQTPETARASFERVDIAFHGYDQDTRELFEIPEVRSFVYQPDEQFPFWLFFLSKRHLGLQCLLLCFLPPYLTEQARSRIFPERIAQLLSSRWFPAMNQICEYAGFSERQVKQLTDRVVNYISDGMKLPDS